MGCCESKDDLIPADQSIESILKDINTRNKTALVLLLDHGSIVQFERELVRLSTEQKQPIKSSLVSDNGDTHEYYFEGKRSITIKRADPHMRLDATQLGNTWVEQKVTSVSEFSDMLSAYSVCVAMDWKQLRFFEM